MMTKDQLRARLAKPHRAFAVAPSGNKYSWFVWESWNTDEKPIAKGSAENDSLAESAARERASRGGALTARLFDTYATALVASA